MKRTRAGAKLLFIAHTDNLRGGGELSVVELIKAAKARGYRPHVVVPRKGEFSDRLGQIGVEFTPVRYFYWGRPYSDMEHKINLAAVKKIAELIAGRKFDCVITNTLMIPWGALAAAMADRPHIWITREKLNQHRSHLRDHYDFIEAYSNVVFANSKDNADYLKTEIGLKNVRQFYSFVDEKGLKLGLKSQKPRIINLSAVVQPSKDQFELVKALAALKKRGQLSLKTVFIGGYGENDAYFKEIKAFIQRSGLSDDISFAGFHSEPFKLMGENDIFVRPSKYESLGRTITEAMKLGLLVVAADIPSSEEAFELGGGVLYKSGNPQSLAKALEKIISAPERYQKLAGRARQRILQNLSEEACHDPFFKELGRVIGQPNPRRELRHIFTQFSSLISTVESLETQARQYKELTKKYQRELKNITNSRGYKAVVLARKALGR